MMSDNSVGGVVRAIQYDLTRLHDVWMELVFPRQLDPPQVLGKWKPDSLGKKGGYLGWAGLGILMLIVGYPVLLTGFILRFHAQKFDSIATRLGVTGVIVASTGFWGLLTIFAKVQFTADGFLAVSAASGVAVVSAALSVVTSRRGSRLSSVVVAYPLGVTAIFLPPVVAALYSPTIASVVFPGSTSLAVWILDNLLFVGGLNTIIRHQFELQGVSYVGMWFALAVPLGWLLGCIVSLTNAVRPTRK